MGIYDRDYYRSSPSRGGFGHFALWSVTTWLIVANVVVFFADTASQRMNAQPQVVQFDDETYEVPTTPARPLLTEWGSYSITKAVWEMQVWRVITYQFLHIGPWHLLANMLGLYFFGPIVEGHFGSRRYLAFYLICGVAGALSFTGMAITHVLHTSPATPLIGASAGIFGLLVAAAVIAPRVEIFYYFFSVTILTLAIGGMLLATYAVLADGNGWGSNAGGEAAHLGGGMMGFVLMKNQHWLNIFSPGAKRVAFAAAPRKRRARVQQKDWTKDFNR